ncbi:MAG: MFS transporter [Firmicutes bacterium]|nr:MFS transporter [Bacillota bacterium]
MKLNYVKTIKVGIAFAICMAFWTTYNFAMPLLLENAYGFSNTLRGLIMGAGSFIGLILLPIFGKLSDNTKGKVARFGKRTPYIFIGTIVTVLLMAFVPLSATSQLNKAVDLRKEITNTAVEGYSYTDSKGKTYNNASELYTMIYEKGAENSDYADYAYLKNNGIDSLAKYLAIAENPSSGDYDKFVKTGINTYASDEVFEKLTKTNGGGVAGFMVILFFALVAVATFRSPAVALMPDVTPKPLRSPANAIINLAGGLGGALAFIIYTAVFLFNPTGYTLVFGLTAGVMLILLALFVKFVNEPKMVKECEDLCLEYNLTDEEEQKAESENSELISADAGQDTKKRAKLVSFCLILASIFMWFLGYQAINANLSIYLTKTLNIEPGFGGIITGVSMGISAVAFIPVGMLAGKIGRKKSIIIGFFLALVSFILIFFFASAPVTAVAVLFTAFFLISGFGMIIANVNTFPMVVELSDKKSIGKYTGLYYTATMSSQAITPFIAGLIMDRWGNKFMFLYAVFAIAVGIVLMMLVKHGDSKPVPKSNA